MRQREGRKTWKRDDRAEQSSDHSDERRESGRSGRMNGFWRRGASGGRRSEAADHSVENTPGRLSLGLF